MYIEGHSLKIVTDQASLR